MKLFFTLTFAVVGFICGISFLERAHPAEWQIGVQDFKNDIKKFSEIK
jgi:hypothetical protein